MQLQSGPRVSGKLSADISARKRILHATTNLWRQWREHPDPRNSTGLSRPSPGHGAAARSTFVKSGGLRCWMLPLLASFKSALSSSSSLRIFLVTRNPRARGPSIVFCPFALLLSYKPPRANGKKAGGSKLEERSRRNARQGVRASASPRMLLPYIEARPTARRLVDQNWKNVLGAKSQG